MFTARSSRLGKVPSRIGTAEQRTARPAPKEADKFYSSPEWRHLLGSILKERGRRCEDKNCKNPRGPWSRIYGDHIIEIQDGGARLDRRNVLLRCPSCHTLKTIAERNKRFAAPLTCEPVTGDPR